MTAHDTKTYDFTFKIVLVGDSGVGKSSLLARLADDAFSTSHISTIGVDFKVYTIDIDGARVKLHIWDTAGQERFRTITNAYYRGADGVAVVYDTTKPKTFQHVTGWLDEIERSSRKSVSTLLIGNKMDLISQRMVTVNQASEFATKLGVKYVETSAADDVNVQAAFQEIAQQIKRTRAAELVRIRPAKSPRPVPGVKLTSPCDDADIEARCPGFCTIM